MRCTLGVDIGTSSSKGVLVAEDGAIATSSTRSHEVDRPRSGWVEMDGRVWWDEFELGEAEITRVGGSSLTSQAAGAKVVWVADEEPEAWACAQRVFMPASWLVRRLTGTYVLDHQSASQMTPLYGIENDRWYGPWWEQYAAGIEQPALAWAGDIAGEVTEEAASLTGIPAASRRGRR